MDEDIKDFLKNADETEDEFIEYLLKSYDKLQNIQPMVINYLQSFKAAQNMSSENVHSKDKSVKISDFIFKQKLIEWLKRQEK